MITIEKVVAQHGVEKRNKLLTINDAFYKAALSCTDVPIVDKIKFLHLVFGLNLIQCSIVLNELSSDKELTFVQCYDKATNS
jgi:hypothetical protein